ncbi:MAG: O-antigen ligase-like protein [Desulfotomaculum sp. 46_296]|nr:MAG: O-antigen ligase-like protein [Desulfotomaculum sp. 46_296]HAG08467.1 polymerase [Desulfotomaculum sp.]HAU32662.1 polymerase [Desulfotomaculum sp.]
MDYIKNWLSNCKKDDLFNIRFIILWFMVSIYPLAVIPHPLYISFFNGTVVPPGYFYLPRYVILAFIAIIALIILIKDRVPVNHSVFIPLIFFIIFIIISSFNAPVQITAWVGSPYRYTGASTYFFCIILFILASTCSAEKTEKLLRSMLITGAVVSILALLQYFNINLVPHTATGKALISYGTMPHPNFLGTYTSFLLPASVLFFMRTQKKLFLILSILIYIGLLVSLCRGTWLASLAGILIIAFYIRKKQDHKRNFFFVLLIFTAIIMVLLPLRESTLLNRIFSISGEVAKGVNMNHQAGTYRLFIWEHVIRLLPHFWAFGVGPDSLIYAMLKTPINEIADKAHNIYLEIAVTMGVFALASYLAFLSFFLKKWKNEIGLTLFAMIAVYLIQGFSNIDVVPIMPLFWIALGLSLASRKETAPIKPLI